MAIQIGHAQPRVKQALAQVAQLALDQVHRVRSLSPELARQVAAQQLRLHMQRAERCKVKGQFYAPQLILDFSGLGFVLRLFLWRIFALEFDL